MTTPTESADAPDTPPTRRRRRSTGTYAAADARRAAIVESATAQFAQAGYLSASLARIADDAGTSATVVLHHFGTKERLLMAVLERRELRTVERLAELEAQGRLNSLRDVLDFSLEQTAYNLAHPGLLQLFIKLSAEAGAPDHPARPYFVERYRNAVELMGRVLRGAVDRGELRPDTDVHQVASELLAVSDGLQVQWALADSPFDLSGAISAYFERLARAISLDGRSLGTDRPA